MRLRWPLVVLGLGAVLAIGAVFCYLSGIWKPRDVVIGVLNHATVAEEALSGFKAGLAAYGYGDERGVRFIYAGPKINALLEEEARRLVGLEPDLILALSTPAAKAAQQAMAGTRIPLVFAPASDPVASGLVDSLGHPGRNSTGVTFGIQEPVRLQWLSLLMPSLRAVLILYDPDDHSPRLSVEKLKRAAQDSGLRLELRHVRDVAGLDAALEDIPEDVGVIFIPVDAFVASHQSRIMAAAAGRGLPVTTPSRRGVVQGALMSYGFDLTELGRQAARIAAQILAGTPAGDLPVETAEFKLCINLETARKLEITIADDVLRQAEIVRGGRVRDAP